jgi:secretion/DNA translocation related TadE-like protein
VTIAMIDVGAAVAARHRVEAAADLAALAAAALAVRGPETACTRAAGVAAGSGGRLVRCRLQGWEAYVEVEAGVGLSGLGDVTVRGRARAGPAAADPPIPSPSHESSSTPVAMITPSGRR